MWTVRANLSCDKNPFTVKLLSGLHAKFLPKCWNSKQMCSGAEEDLQVCRLCITLHIQVTCRYQPTLSHQTAKNIQKPVEHKMTIDHAVSCWSCHHIEVSRRSRATPTDSVKESKKESCHHIVFIILTRPWFCQCLRSGDSDNDLRSAQLLLENRADINQVVKPQGVMKMFELIYRAYGCCCRSEPSIIARAMMDLSTTPVGCCALYDNERLLIFLLRAGADKEIKNNRGKRAVDIARSENLRAILQDPSSLTQAIYSLEVNSETVTQSFWALQWHLVSVFVLNVSVSPCLLRPHSWKSWFATFGNCISCWNRSSAFFWRIHDLQLGELFRGKNGLTGVLFATPKFGNHPFALRVISPWKGHHPALRSAKDHPRLENDEADKRKRCCITLVLF